MNKPREPTRKELAQLNALLKQTGQPMQNIKTYWFAVFDDYVSDCPAYVGKLMMAVLHPVF